MLSGELAEAARLDRGPVLHSLAQLRVASNSMDHHDFESPQLCKAFLLGRCRKGKRCWMVHEKKDEVNPGKMKRFKSRAD